MLIIAIANGAIRDLGYKKSMGDLAAHQFSTVTLILFFALYIQFIIKRFPPASSSQAAMIGILWTIMTLAFEFGFGRWRGNAWSKLLEDYNVLKGRLWIFIPLWISIAPYIFYRFRK
jgi:hypothetical protein